MRGNDVHNVVKIKERQQNTHESKTPQETLSITAYFALQDRQRGLLSQKCWIKLAWNKVRQFQTFGRLSKETCSKIMWCDAEWRFENSRTQHIWDLLPWNTWWDKESYNKKKSVYDWIQNALKRRNIKRSDEMTKDKKMFTQIAVIKNMHTQRVSEQNSNDLSKRIVLLNFSNNHFSFPPDCMMEILKEQRSQEWSRRRKWRALWITQTKVAVLFVSVSVDLWLPCISETAYLT